MHIKLRPNSKKPEGDHWIVSEDSQEITQWCEDGYNLGRVLLGITVVDFDDKESAREFYRIHRDILGLIIETRKGAHFFFSGSTQNRKFEKGDIKSDGGYVVCPPSVVSGFRYRVVQDSPLQPFPEELFPRQEPASVLQVNDAIKDIRAYIRKITSISGQHGHNAAFRVACVLRDAGLSEIDALTEMIEWNRECASPEWTIRDLTKKVKDAYKSKGTP